MAKKKFSLSEGLNNLANIENLEEVTKKANLSEDKKPAKKPIKKEVVKTKVALKGEEVKLNEEKVAPTKPVSTTVRRKKRTEWSAFPLRIPVHFNQLVDNALDMRPSESKNAYIVEAVRERLIKEGLIK